MSEAGRHGCPTREKSHTSQCEARWAKLMRAANRGDADAYGCVLAELVPALRAMASRGFSSRGIGSGDVEDVVQDVLLAIHLKRRTWNEGHPLLPWIGAITRNKLIDNLRKRDPRARVPLDDIAERLADDRSFDDTSAIDVPRILATLKGRQRQIVQAISIEGVSASQIAGRLAMTESAVRVALHRALQSLSAAFRDA
jgi:RNA polymerase sigma-70 factor (ECF subfamily)